jgi:alkaline phosphatase D
VASEFAGASVTALAPEASAPQRLVQLLPENPHLKFADDRYRGYVRVEVTPKEWRADLRAMETVKKADAACSTLATFSVADGRPGPQRV